MRLSIPRIAPTADDELDDQQAPLISPLRDMGRDFNIFRTFVRHPDAFRAFQGWGRYIMSDRNTLAAREREILILRTGWLCRAGYEWARHVPHAQRAGITETQIDELKRGAGAACWTPADRSLIQAADMLVKDHFVTDAGWEALSAHFSERQCMDVLLTVGQYAMVSMFLNSLGVQIDADVKLDPDLEASE